MLRLCLQLLGLSVAGIDSTSDFSDFLLSRDLVVLGIVVAKEEVDHPQSGGCGNSPGQPVSGTQYEIRADSVLFGSMKGTVLRVFDYGRGGAPPGMQSLWDYPEGSDLPGKRVVAYATCIGHRMDGFWGSLAPIAEDGTLLCPPECHYDFSRSAPGKPRTLDVLMDVLERKRRRHPTTALEGSQSAALVRITSVTSTGRVLRARCEPLVWVAGHGTKIPTLVQYPILPQCGGVQAGDTVLVPVPRHFRGGTLAVEFCPNRLVLKDGLIPTLSATRDDIRQALVEGPDGLHVLSQRPVAPR